MNSLAHSSRTAVLQALPKIELHCHLDGSVPVALFEELAASKVPGVPHSRAALMQAVQAPKRCRTLAEYLQSFKLTLQILQDMDILWQATHRLGGQLADENVVYAELRFSPHLLASASAPPDTVVRTVLDAARTIQRERGIVLRLLLCMMRHQDDAANHEVLGLAHHYLTDGVCGVDLAGDEAAFPAEAFSGLFRQAAAMGLPYTIHAGECGSVENISASVRMGARRIGHGIAARHSAPLCRQLAAEGILLENCPISNLQTSAISAMAEYPTLPFAAQGIPVCINTDNRTVSGTTLVREYDLLCREFPAADLAFLKARTLDALNGAFLTSREKQPLAAAIEIGYASLP